MPTYENLLDDRGLNYWHMEKTGRLFVPIADGAPGPPPAFNILDTNPMGYWRADTGIAGTDLNWVGIVGGTATLSAAALMSDVHGPYIQTSPVFVTLPVFPNTTGSFTTLLWTYLEADEANWATMISRYGNSGGNGGFGMQRESPNPSNLQGFVGAGGVSATAAVDSLPNGSLFKLWALVNATQMKVRANGVESAYITATTRSNQTAAAPVVGKNSTYGQPSRMRVRAVAIWDRELTSDEVAKIETFLA